MNDQLITVLAAVRRAQAELAAFLEEPGGHNAEVTIAKLISILERRDVVRAIRLLDPPAESPSLVPHDGKNEMVPSPPLWR
jgi:hypothetical protein